MVWVPFSTPLCFLLLEILKYSEVKQLNIIGACLLLGLNVSFVSCTSKQANEQFPPMHFNSDSQLLADEKIENSGIELQLPSDFEQVPIEIFQTLKTTLEGLKNPILKTEVLHAYTDTIGALFILSKLDEPNLFEKLDHDFEASLRMVWNNSIIRSQFSSNDINFIHYQLYNDSYVNIKIFIEEGDGFQLDYTMPKKYYRGYSQKIESSISTINHR